MTRYKRLFKNTLVISIGNLGSKFIALLMLPFYTQHLSVSDFGASDTVLVYVALLLGIVTLSISESFFIYPKNKTLEEQSEIFSSGISFTFFVLCLSICILSVLYYLFISYKILQSFTQYFCYLCVLLILMAVQNITQQFTRGIDNLVVYSISGIILTGFTAFFGYLFIPSKGLEGLFLSLIIANFFTIIYTVIHGRMYKYWSYNSIDFSKYKELTSYSIPLIPNALMWWVISSLNRPFLERQVGIDEIGLFAIALKVPAIINVIFGIFMIAWHSSVLEEFKRIGYVKFYRKIFFIVSGFLVIISIIISFLRIEIIQLIANDKFVEAAKFIPLLTISAIFASLSGFVGANFSAVKQSKYYFYSSIWGACSSMSLNILLIPVYGVWGAVYALIASQFLMFLSRVIYSNHIVSLIK